MVTKEMVEQWKREGKIIITSQAFRKSVNFIENDSGATEYEYKGKRYQGHKWILTYNGYQFKMLIP